MASKSQTFLHHMFRLETLVQCWNWNYHQNSRNALIYDHQRDQICRLRCSFVGRASCRVDWRNKDEFHQVLVVCQAWFEWGNDLGTWSMWSYFMGKTTILWELVNLVCWSEFNIERPSHCRLWWERQLIVSTFLFSNTCLCQDFQKMCHEKEKAF